MNRRCFVVNLKGLIGYGEGLVLQEKPLTRLFQEKLTAYFCCSNTSPFLP